MGRSRFVTMKLSICRMTDITPADKIVLARIAGFDDYFESAEKCAELLGYTPGTVRKVKQKLEKKGYIIATSNNGRGKHYVAREDFRVKKRKKVAKPSPAETTNTPNDTDNEVNAQAETQQPKIDTSMLKPSASTRRSRNDWGNWEKQHKDLIPALDRCVNYLTNRGIPILDPKSLRRNLTITSDLYRRSDSPDFHVRIITQYIDYLESPQYEYQATHTKYCPIVSSQYDLFSKFNAIREFYHDESRHYDPRKTLTR